MNSKTTIAAVAYSGQAGFQVESVEIDPPRADEILVKIKGVGICHTDLVFSSGEIPYPFPAVFGHEGSGVVEAVGRSVTKVKAGDHVLISFRSCGSCDHCEHDDAAYCRNLGELNMMGARQDGTSSLKNDSESIASNFFGQSSFAAHAITYERNVVKVDDDVPIELLGPLGCSVQTGAGAVMRSFEARKGSSILITGGGSVGLSAVMGAVIQECATIIVVEPVAERRELALELGATHCIDPTTETDLAKSVREIVPLGIDNALDTTAIVSVINDCFATLGSKGTLGLLGMGTPPEAKLPGTINDLFNGGLTIKVIIEGDSDPDQFLPELVALFRAGRLPLEKLITTYPLEQINQAVDDQHSGKCIKAVLLPSS